MGEFPGIPEVIWEKYELFPSKEKGGIDIMNMEEFKGFKVIKSNKIQEYKHAGVWAMFGIQKANNPQRKYTCLNVGKNICVGEELKIDFKRIEKFELVSSKEYRNQFNEVMFSYDEYATRQDWLYKEISEKYDEIIFILVSNQSENTYIIEKYFAYSTKSAYWVSNGRYSTNREINNTEIEKIRSDIDVSKIDKSLIDRIDEFKDWYDNQ